MKVYIRIIFLILGDFLAFFGTFMLTAGIHQFFCDQCRIAEYLKMWPFGILFIMINEVAKLYHGTMFYPGAAFGHAEELRRLFYAVTSVFVGILLFILINKQATPYSELLLIVSWPITLLAVILTRWGIRSIFKRYSLGCVNALILGAGKRGRKTARILGKSKHLGIKPVGFLDDDRELHNAEFESLPVYGSINELPETASRLKVDYIIICLPLEITAKVTKDCCGFFKHVMIIPSGEMFSSLWVYAYDIGGMLGLELRCNLLLKWPLFMKKLTDISLAVIISILTAPVMLFCALMIMLTSRGPVIYKARRLGLNGQPFDVYKFRTMRVSADEKLEIYLESKPEVKKEWQENFKLKHDPRITWVGALLRRTSLDELPQLFNVFKGEMSLIGPRPIVESELPQYGDKYAMIASIKPGITGMWQVSGRSNTDYSERVELDCYYLMNWNIWLDFFIILKTVKEVLFCNGAY